VLWAIAACLQKAWQYNEETYVELKVPLGTFNTKKGKDPQIFLESPLREFNEKKGHIKVGYPADRYSQADFLLEEKQLLDNVCLEVGNLLERKEIKDGQEGIRRQVEQADRLRILGEITAGIAHEFNTPLANILGFAELLKERVEGDPKAVKDLDKIITNSIFSREVVKKLMFFACEMPQERTLLNIVPIIEDAIALMQTTLRQNRINCELMVDKKEIILRMDKIQLTQVLFNLIVNAVYFSPPKSTIRVEVQENPGHVLLRISDQGSGIPQERADSIFAP